tara:strand:- start:3345 stop:3572 length:228 start_codon:yes stop_codon:yes gene_type:complete
MDWDFYEDCAFKALKDAFEESGESSALEFLADVGSSYFHELIQNAAGDGFDLSDSSSIKEFQDAIIESLEGEKLN